MLRIYLLILLLVTLFTFPFNISAQENLVTVKQLKSPIELQTKIPGTSSYLLDRVWEKLSQKLLFMKDSQINYSKKLLKKRFSELVFLAEKQDSEEIEKATQRFSSQAGTLTDLVKDQPLKERVEVITIFNSYKDDLNKIIYNYPQDSGFWILMLHDINTLDIMSARLKN